METIKKFSNGTILKQGRGKFDDYCVYIKRDGENEYAPTDKECFAFFIKMAKKYDAKRIYKDYAVIYDRTSAQRDMRVLDEIEEISKAYPGDEDGFAEWFSVLYLAMIAEENKKYSVLGKRIKRLGMYQILFENMAAGDAAFFSVGKKVAQLSPMCKERGF